MGSYKIITKKEVEELFPEFQDDIIQHGIYGRLIKVYKGHPGYNLYEEELSDDNGIYIIEPNKTYHILVDKYITELPTHHVCYIPLDCVRGEKYHQIYNDTSDLHIVHERSFCRTEDRKRYKQYTEKDDNLFYLSSISNENIIYLKKNDPIIIFAFGKKTEEEIKLEQQKTKYPIRKDEGYQDFRYTVINRDKVCQCCGTKKQLDVHHILPYSDYEDFRVDPNNGILLCRSCHTTYHRLYGYHDNINSETLNEFLEDY